MQNGLLDRLVPSPAARAEALPSYSQTSYTGSKLYWYKIVCYKPCVCLLPNPWEWR